MNLLEEHIKLLQAQFDIIQRNYAPIRKYRAGRNCQRGYNCGGSCITRSKNCRKALPGEAKDYAAWLTAKLDPKKVGMLVRGGFSPSEAAILGRKDLSDEQRLKLSPSTVDENTQAIVKGIADRELDGERIREFMDESLGVKESSLERFRQEIAKDESRKDFKVPADIMAENKAALAKAEQEFKEIEDFAKTEISKDTLKELPQQFQDIIEAGRRQGLSDENIVMGLQQKQAKLNREIADRDASKPAPPPKAELAPIPKAIQDEIAKRGPDFDFLVEDYRYGVDGKAKAEQALANAKTKAEKNAAREQVDRYRAAARDGYTMRSKLPQAMQTALNNSRASGSLFGKNQDPTNPRDPANTEEILINQWRRDGLIADPFNEAGMPTRKPRR